MARTQVEVKHLSWNLLTGTTKATLFSRVDDNTIHLSAGVPWTRAIVNGKEAQVHEGGMGKFIVLTLSEGKDVTAEFV